MVKVKASIFYRELRNFIGCLFYYRSLKLLLSSDLTIDVIRLWRNNVKFPHPVGIVIGQAAEIGKECVIYQGVTIGTKWDDKSGRLSYPKIGDNVVIGAGSSVIGGITLGSNVIVGANSLVNKDVPSSCIVVGNPCRILENRN